MTMYSQTLLLQLKGTYKPSVLCVCPIDRNINRMMAKSITLYSQPAASQLAKCARPRLSSSCFEYCSGLLWLLSVWPRLFILPFPNKYSISSVSPSRVLAFANFIPLTVWWSTDRKFILSHGDKSGCQTGTGKVLSQSKFIIGSHVGSLTLALPPSPSFSESGKGGARRREGRNKRKWQTEKTILPFVELVVCECFRGRREGGVFLSTCWAALWTEK